MKEVALTAILAFLLSICSVGQSSVLRRRLYKIVLQFFSKHITPELPNRPHPERLGYKMPYKKIKYRQYVLPNIYRQNVLGVDVLQHFVSRHSAGIDVSWVDSLYFRWVDVTWEDVP